MDTRGRFITFEGIEGCGKTVQLQLARENLGMRGIPCVSTLEPGGTAFGEELRTVLLHTQGAQRMPVSELLLYLADRYQHLRELVEPALARGIHVLCDRYHDATLVYQGYARGVGIELIDHLSDLLDIRIPDRTIVIDVPVPVGLERARRRNLQGNHRQGRFEAEDLDFHERVRKGYLHIASLYPERIRVVDGSGNPDEVFQRVLAAFPELA